MSSVTAAVSSNGVPLGIDTLTVICVLSISGINAVPLEIAAAALIASNPRAPIKTIGLNLNDSSNIFSYPLINTAKNLSSFCSFVFVSTLDAIAGTTVSAITRLASRE